MSVSFSLEGLKDLIKEDDSKKSFHVDTMAPSPAIKNALIDVYKHVGMVEGDEHAWRRPFVQSYMFRNPTLPSKTALVDYKSLSSPVRSKVSNPPAPDATSTVVEVPADILSYEEDRPVQGNLSDKLTEYTRGATFGTNRGPFRPSGMETDELPIKEPDLYRTPECIERSRTVLNQDVRTSWLDGKLLTALPGTNIREGMSWKDVYGEDLEPSNSLRTEDQRKIDAFNHGPIESELSAREISQKPQVDSRIYSKEFFDDDSLFGSSSDEEEGIESDFDEAGDDEEILENHISQHHAQDVLKAFEESQTQLPVKDHSEDDELEDIDTLLSELDVTKDSQITKKAANVTTDPLVLAERQKNRSEQSRKAWATTKLLPIDDFQSFVPNPALEFPFTLDGFQQQAIARLERSESVFVAAHTSAGKTVGTQVIPFGDSSLKFSLVVAEYAVAMAMQRATRCVYTSPIKALSNQKFRDFSLKFGSDNVGLVTGDLQVNVDRSSCIIMTTEILRSMLYRGADLIRDIEYVVFDEVHYVNDTERGVVWEEVIIMIPSNVTLIFLSATTPNTLEFSDWIGRTKRKQVFVVKTDYRPVPLSHYLWAGNKLHKILEGNGAFIDQGYADSVKALRPSSKDATKNKQTQQKGRPPTGSKQLAWQAQGSKQNWMSLVRFLDREILIPAVIFSFSKKKCEEIARMLGSCDLNDAKERRAVKGFVRQTVARLSPNDAVLPQVLVISEMVQRGIGVHHGGLLPLLKEMVEILFSKNLIKVLLATETFAMGVNMPAKAVVFNSIRKHDGNEFRVLSPGEYTQMAGRKLKTMEALFLNLKQNAVGAGRRSLDKVGTVILCAFGEMPPPQALLRQMLTGTSTRLSSQFRLTYNMILNLLKVEEMSVESMIKRSFSEFATQRALTANKYPELLAKGERTLEKLESDHHISMADFDPNETSDYYKTCCELTNLMGSMLLFVQENDAGSFQEILQPGRILQVTSARQDGVVRGPGMMLQSPTTAADGTPSFVCAVLLPSSFIARPALEAEKGAIGYIGQHGRRFFKITSLKLHNIVLVVSRKLKIDPSILFKGKSEGGAKMIDRDGVGAFAGMKALRKEGSFEIGKVRTNEDKILTEIIQSLEQVEMEEIKGTGSPYLDFRTLLKRGIDVGYYRRQCDELDSLILRLRSNRSHRHPNLEMAYKSIESKEILREKVHLLRHILSNESLQLFPDFLQRKKVLKRLGYIDENETVAIKGRVACEVNTCEELLATEIVFEGLLSKLTPEETVAVLSSLVFQESRNDQETDLELPPRIASCCEKMKELAYNLGMIQKDCGLPVDPIDYCEQSMKFGLVHVVYEWALGIPFKEVVALTDVQEGSIVRCITRLDELCREIRNCARVIGNPTLYRQAEFASAAIKRDIVFASSLYVT